MMMIFFWDVETTGLINNQLAFDHPAQPRIVQIAGQMCNEAGAIFGGFSFIVNPGVKIPDAASKVHGITNDVAELLGVSPHFALDTFNHFYDRADTLCAHNINYDRAVTEGELARNHKGVVPFGKPCFCTMRAASPLVNLPPTERMLAAGFNKPKPPKLEEAIKFFFDETLEGAHDAMVDVIACRRIYLHLKSLEAARAH